MSSGGASEAGVGAAAAGSGAGSSAAAVTPTPGIRAGDATAARVVCARAGGQQHGGAKSGRPWKSLSKQRTSAMTRPRGGNVAGSSFRAQTATRRALESSRAVEKQRVDELEEKKADLKRKREEKAKRKAENDLKSSTFQEIKHPEKLKQMNKKQLRQVKKTRVNEHGVVELVGAYE